MVKHAPRFARHVHHVVGMGLTAVVWSVLLVATSRADSPRDGTGPAPTTNANTESDANGASDSESGQERQRRERVVTGGMLLVAGIAAAGAALLGLVVLWGVRVRRILRQPLPEQSARDEFWYLKSKKETPSGGARDVSAADDGEAEP